MKLFILLVVLFEVSHHSVCSGHSAKDVISFLVRIEAKGKILDCAGTIVAPHIVLTSAHCVDRIGPSDVTVTHFGRTLKTYETALIIIYPTYRENTMESDIALLQMYGPFEEPYTVLPLSSLSSPPRCSAFHIVGWSGEMYDSPLKEGVQFDGKPMITLVNLIPNSECKNIIHEFLGSYKDPENLCGVTNDDGECFTGPGGPLLCTLSSASTASTTEKRTTTAPTTTKVAVTSIEGNGLTRNETLAEPIDLLANLEKSQSAFVQLVADEEPVPTFIQFGVVSWGKSCSKIPSVYVRTDLYYPWITQHLKPPNISLYPHYTFLTPLKGAASQASMSIWWLVPGTIALFVRISICSSSYEI